MSKPRAALVANLSAVCLAACLVATSCSRPVKETVGGGTTGGAPSGTATGAGNSITTPVNPPFPGPYKTVEKDGVEWRQGRYPQGQYGGTLVYPQIASDPKTFNPWEAADATSGQLGGYLWSSLLSTDSYNGDVYPDLAAEYKVEPDHLTYTTRLRKGLKWSDGQPITSEDVAFTYNTLIAGGYGNSSLRDVISVEGQMPKVEVVDQLTNKFVTAKPFAPFLRSALQMPIAPKHVLEKIVAGSNGHKAFAQWQASSNFDPKTMITSGPFTVSRFLPAQRTELVRTKNYYVLDPAGKQLPYLDKIVFLSIPDVSTNLLKFKGKDTDITGIRNRDVSELTTEQQKLNFKIYNLGVGTGTTFIMFNENRRKNDKGKPYVTPYKSVWFNDVNFRQAVNRAINRQHIIDGYLKGIGVATFVDMPQNSPFFDTSLKAFPLDTAGAQKLLQQSGFVKKADGNLYDKDGHPVEFDLTYGAGGTFFETVASYVAEDLKALGMKVNVQAVEFNSLSDKIDSSKDWEACLYSLTGGLFEPNDGANVWRSNGRLHLFDERDADANGTIVVKDARDWEKQIDEVFDRGVEVFPTPDRKAIYDKYEQIVYQQAPFIYLVSPNVMIAARSTIQNYQPTQLSQTVWGLHNLDEIWMSTGAKSNK